MKNFFIISVLLQGILSNVYGQNTAPGYYVNTNNDTISAEIRMNTGLFGSATNDYFITLIEIKDATGNFKKFKPDDIKAYGFKKNGVTHRMVSKPSRHGKNTFLAPVVTGPAINLYQYSIFTQSSPISYNQVFYTFEKKNGQTLYIQKGAGKKFKNELKHFSSEFPGANTLIDSTFIYFEDYDRDLTNLLTYINNLETNK